MTEHPLTDEKCRKIANDVCFQLPLHVDENMFWPARMRAAADWQLEQVIEFIAKEDTVYADYIKKSMRPNTTTECNDSLPVPITFKKQFTISTTTTTQEDN